MEWVIGNSKVGIGSYLIPIHYYLFTYLPFRLLFFATPSLLTARLLAGVISRVILGGKDVTGMAYPEGFR